MAGLTKISLHIGVHKTASTHLQKSLAKNKELLRQNGVTYLGPGYFRNKNHSLSDLFGLGPNRQSVDAQDDTALVARLAKGAQTLVISEENILGPTLSDLNPGIPYPRADLRLKRFLASVAPHPVDVFVALREPSGWLASLYSQRVKGGDTRSFSEFVGPNAPDRWRWSHLIKRLTDVAGDRTIHVWQQEDYPAVAVPVLRRMIGWRLGPQVQQIDAVVNERLSAAAIQQLIAWKAEGKAGEARDWAKMARDLHPVEHPSQVFDPWTDEEKDKSRQAYAHDLARIADMTTVAMIKPSRRSLKLKG